MKGIRLADDKRKHLLEVYLEQGYHAALPLTIEYGVTEKMLSLIARQNGHFYNYPHGQLKKTYKRTSDHDPRWQRAIERGAVIA